MDKHAGSCLCGNIKFTALGPPLRVGICHCKDCRKHHGAAFYAAAIFDKASVKIFGETNNYQGRHFCPNCGSSVFACTGNEVELHLGALDSENTFTPTYEGWTSRRENWLPEFPNMKQSKHDP